MTKLEKLNDVYYQNGKLQKFIHKFFYSEFYIAMIAAVVLIAWATKSAVFGFLAMSVIAIVALALLDDILPLVPVVSMMAGIIFSDNVNDFLFMWPAFVFVGIAAVYFAVRNWHRWRFGQFFLPQVVLSVVLLLGGIGACSMQEYTSILPTSLFLGVGLLAIYALFFQYVKTDDKRDYGLYIAKTLMYLGLLATVQTAISVGGLIAADTPIFALHDRLTVGWGISNNIATVLLLTAPMTLYVSTRYKNGFFYAAAGVFQYIGIFLTMSRGGMLCALITMPFALFFSIKRASCKPTKQLIFYAISIVIVAVFYGIVHDDINNMIQGILNKGVDTSGRGDLYAEAWELFKTYPAFGRGLGYTGPNYNIDVVQFYWFHSTLFQVLASLGTVGFVGYALYYFGRFKIVFKNIKNTFNIFVLIAMLAFEGYCMIDTGTFIPFPQMTLILVLTLVTEYANLSPKSGPVDYYNRSNRFNAAVAYAETFDCTYQRVEARTERIDCAA